MRTPGLSVSELRKQAKAFEPVKGWVTAEVQAAAEGISTNNNETMRLSLRVLEGNAEGKGVQDWLTGVGRGSMKLRRACEAVGALDRYEAGNIDASDFTGKTVRIKLGVEKRRGYADRQVVEDYEAPRQQSDST